MRHYYTWQQLLFVGEKSELFTDKFTIIEESETGSIGDGKIFVFDVENVYRIRTSESGEVAI